MKLTTLTAALVLIAAQAGAAPAASTAKTASGDMLTTAEGMTLYTFDKDKPGVSNCAGDCAKLWPPMIAPANAKTEGGFSVIAREDGTKQWAYKGAPLYTFAKDAAKGDTSGDGVKGVWHIARP